MTGMPGDPGTTKATGTTGESSSGDVRIDAHHHVWDLDVRPQAWLSVFPSIHRSFLLDELRPLLAEAGVDGTVLVQVGAVPAETEEFLALAAREPLICGVVGWVDLTSGAVADEIARLRTLPGGDLLVGVRALVESETDPRWLLRDDVLDGLRALAGAGLVYDLLVTHDQLPAAVEVVGRVPELRFVLDHLGKPPIAAGGLDPWREQITALAAYPHVVAKLSGLVTEAGDGWTLETIRPFAEHLLQAFGPDRVMVGSDWPVCLVGASSYAQVTELHDSLVAHLTPAERAAIRGGAAVRWYGLGGGPTA